jgi:hypothetical protein
MEALGEVELLEVMQVLKTLGNNVGANRHHPSRGIRHASVQRANRKNGGSPLTAASYALEAVSKRNTLKVLPQPEQDGP